MLHNTLFFRSDDCHFGDLGSYGGEIMLVEQYLSVLQKHGNVLSVLLQQAAGRKAIGFFRIWVRQHT